MAKKLSSRKAMEILHDGMVRGHALTPKQRRYMGYMAGKTKSTKSKKKKY